MHMYFFSHILTIVNCFGTFLIVSFSLPLFLFMLVVSWHLSVNLLWLKTLFILELLHLLILLLSLFGSMMMMLTRHSQRTFLDEVFIQNTKSFWQTLPTLTFPLSFIVGNGSHCVTSRSLILSCLSNSFTPTCTGLIVQYLFSSLAFEIHTFLSHHDLLRMCFGSLG